MISTRCLVTKKDSFGKKKGCNLVYANMASLVYTLACIQDRGVFIAGKRKLMEEEVRTKELYYKVLLIIEVFL